MKFTIHLSAGREHYAELKGVECSCEEAAEALAKGLAQMMPSVTVYEDRGEYGGVLDYQEDWYGSITEEEL